MNVAYIYAASWRGLGVNASGEAWVDDVRVDVADEDGRQAITIPDGAKELLIRMTPKRQDFWAGVATFSVEEDGAITSDDPTAGSVAGAGMSGSRISFVGVRLWRLRDVSADVVQLLDLKHRPKVKNRGETFDSDDDYPPSTWKILDRDKIHFVDPDEPLAGKMVGVTEPKAVSFDGEIIALELAIEDAPRLISVAWPNSLLPTEDSDPTPMLIYFRPGVGQSVAAGFYAGNGLKPYPFNHDYAYYGQYQYLWYSRDPLTKDVHPKGIPLQVAESGKDLVTVIPCNAVGHEFGSFMNLDTAYEVILEIQAFMFARAGVARAPLEVGRVALGGFSNGCAVLSAIMANPANRNRPLYRSVARELYFFDPAVSAVDGVVAESLKWLQQGGGDRRVALYATRSQPSLGKLLGWSGGKVPTEPSIHQTDDGSRIVGVIDIETWRRTVEYFLERKAPLYVFDHAHQQIASMFLTHALAKSDF